MYHSSGSIYKNNDLELYYCGTQKCDPGHYWGPAVKEHYKIHFIHSGKGLFMTNKKMYQLKRGQCFLICPNVISYYRADESEPWTYSWVAFNGMQAEEYLLRAGFSPDNVYVDCKLNDEIADCLSEMQKAEDLSFSRDIRLKGMLYKLLSLLIEGAGINHAAVERVTGYRDEYIRKVIEYIQINYSRKINVTDVAQYINLDRKYISALFKTERGVSLQEYLVSYRIEKACSMLLSNKLAIGDIARSIGYDDPLVFSRMFRKYKGISPRDFRNQQ